MGNISVVEQAKALLIQERTKEEQKIAAFAKSITSADPEIFAGVYIPPVFTLEALCPEAYKVNPNPEVYNREYEELVKIIEAINQRIVEYTKEAIECYNQFKALQ